MAWIFDRSLPKVDWNFRKLVKFHWGVLLPNFLLEGRELASSSINADDKAVSQFHFNSKGLEFLVSTTTHRDHWKIVYPNFSQFGIREEKFPNGQKQLHAAWRLFVQILCGGNSLNLMGEIASDRFAGPLKTVQLVLDSQNLLKYDCVPYSIRKASS